LFQPLETEKRSWSRQAISLLVHIVAVFILLLLPAAAHRALAPPDQKLASIFLPPKTSSPPPRPRPKIVSEKISRPEISTKLTKIIPRPQFRIPENQAPAPRPVKTVIPELPPVEVAPASVAKTELPAVGLPSARPLAPVKTGVFESATAAPRGPAALAGVPSAGVRSAGFSDGAAVASGKQGSGSGMSLKVGGFDQGSSSGTGSGRPGGSAVKAGGFDLPSAPSGVARSAPAPHPDTPVEILWKPKPAYTAEARERRVEGEVVLEVLFRASGQISVTRVVRGLGFGLDESARAAAAQIRFRPSARDGNPVDSSGLVHIVFQLS